MKKLYQTIYIVSSFILTTALFGQVEIYDGSNSTTNIAGERVDVVLYGPEYEGFFTVKNVTETTLKFKLIRKQLSPVTFNLMEQLCFGSATGGNCFIVGNDVESYNFPTVVTLEAGANGFIEYVFGNYDIPAEINNRYYVLAEDGTLIDSVDVRAAASLGVKDPIKTTSVSVSSYPNPASSVINVNVNGSNDNTVRLVDVLGKTIYFDKIGTSKKIDVSNLNNGIYILKVSSANGTLLQNKKIIVKH